MDADLASTSSVATLLGTLLSESPKRGPVGEAARGLCSMNLQGEWPFGSEEELAAVAETMAQARNLSAHELDRQFHHLFVGPQHLEAPPRGSVYLDSEAIVFGDSCIALARWMKANGVALHETGTREPADQIGRMLLLLGWLCENDPGIVDEYLTLHLLPWAPNYFELLEKAASREPFYRGLAKLAALSLRDIARRRNLEGPETLGADAAAS